MSKKNTTPLPSVIYARHDDEEGYLEAAQDSEAFEDGVLVGVYDLREVCRQQVTKALVALDGPPPSPAPPRSRRPRS